MTDSPTRGAVPPWAAALPHRPLVALLLVGQWTPGQAEDEAILQQLGCTVEEVAALCVQLQGSSDQPVLWLKPSGEQPFWAWATPQATFRRLVHLFNEGDLGNFRAALLYCYRQLSAEQRGASRSLSGLTQSLVLLSVSDDRLCTDPSGEAWAAAVVEEVLASTMVAAFGDELPLWAEAAPEAFLSVAERWAPGLMASTPYRLALETLAWDATLLRRVVRLYGRVLADASLESPARGEWLRSLVGILGWDLAQTTAGVEERLTVLREYCAHPQLAWELLSVLLDQPEILAISRRPRYLAWDLPDESARQLDLADVAYQQRTYVELALPLCGVDSRRWAELVRNARSLPNPLANQILKAVPKAGLSDFGAPLWQELRVSLTWLKEAEDPTNQDLETRLRLTQKLLKALEPNDYLSCSMEQFVAFQSWPFQERAPFWLIPEAIEEQLAELRAAQQAKQKRLEGERANALTLLFQRQDCWAVLSGLASEGGEHALAQALMARDEAGQFAQRLTRGFDGYKTLAPQFLALWLKGCPFREGAEFIQRLYTAGEYDDALDLAVALRPSAALWELIDQWDEDLQQLYWQSLGPHRTDAIAHEDLPRVVARLIDAGNVATAISLVAAAWRNHAATEALTHLAVMVLDKAPSRSILIEHHVNYLLSRLEEGPGVDPARLLALRERFIGLRQRSQRNRPPAAKPADAVTEDEDAVYRRWREQMDHPAKSAAPLDGPLFPISTLKLQDFRAFPQVELTLHPRLTVIFGQNASGKTSLLRAISAGLEEFLVRLLPDEPRQFGEGDLRISWRQDVPQQAALTRVELQTPTFPVGALYSRSVDRRLRRAPGNLELDDSLSSLRESIDRGEDAPVPLPVFAFYGVDRSLDPKASTAPLPGDMRQARLRNAGLRGALRSTGRLEEAVQWLRSMEDIEAEQKVASGDLKKELPELSAVRAALLATLPGVKNLRMDRKAGTLRLELEQGPLSRPNLAQLSDGYRTHLALVLDLCRRMLQQNPPPQEGSARTQWGTAVPALVLIDEVDLHLHPQWQRKVLAGLLDAFPHAQFVVTTHSPQVLAGVRQKEGLVYKLTAGTDGAPCIVRVNSYGKDSNSVLEEDMDTEERPGEVKNQLAAISRLIDEERFSEAETEIARLQQQLGHDDAALVALRTDITFLRPPGQDSQ